MCVAMVIKVIESELSLRFLGGVRAKGRFLKIKEFGKLQTFNSYGQTLIIFGEGEL